MTSTPFDLLREKRQALGLPDPAEASRLYRQNLVKGLMVGTALVGLSIGLAALSSLRNWMVVGSLERLSTVEADVEQYEARLRDDQARLKQVEDVNGALVKGILSVRSGSALLRDLQMRVPRGIQLTEAKEEPNGAGVQLKGLASDPEPFAAVNALYLELQRSPLLDPSAVILRKAVREQQEGQAASSQRPVSFEFRLGFRPANTLAPEAERRMLEGLGSVGLARRLSLLQQEGLLP